MQLAHNTAIQLVALLLKRVAFVLAIQDAFVLTLAFIGVAIIATLFVPGKRRQRPAPSGPVQEQQPVEESHPVAVEALV